VVRGADEFSNLRKLDEPRKDRDEIEVMNKLLSSDVKLSILELFHSNPGLIDRLEGVALRIGRMTSEIERDVADLLELGILRRKKLGTSEAIYFDLTRDAQIQQIIAERITGGIE